MRIGPLRHPLRIERPIQTQDATTGALTESWETFAEVVKGSIKPLSAREFIAAKATQAEYTSLIRIRYIPGILPSMRVIDIREETIYELAGPPLTDQKSGKHWLTLLGKVLI